MPTVVRSCHADLDAGPRADEVPLPWPVTMRPSLRSTASARRTVGLLVGYAVASSLSDGIRSPGVRWPQDLFPQVADDAPVRIPLVPGHGLMLQAANCISIFIDLLIHVPYLVVVGVTDLRAERCVGR